ncbi:MAG: cell division protein FtsA, partial [Anaerolineae bacterium]|nr:cell division protein FtsA [Anaerolineae bacterium]
MERSVVGIDVGSHKIEVLVGEVSENGETRIVGVGQTPARGVRKGVIVNVADATAAISEAVARAEQSSGYQIERAYVSINGAHISSRN